MYHGINNNIKQLFSNVIIRNAFWGPNQHISIISEESLDTEDWIENRYFKL